MYFNYTQLYLTIPNSNHLPTKVSSYFIFHHTYHLSPLTPTLPHLFLNIFPSPTPILTITTPMSYQPHLPLVTPTKQPPSPHVSTSPHSLPIPEHPIAPTCLLDPYPCLTFQTVSLPLSSSSPHLLPFPLTPLFSLYLHRFSLHLPSLIPFLSPSPCSLLTSLDSYLSLFFLFYLFTTSSHYSLSSSFIPIPPHTFPFSLHFPSSPLLESGVPLPSTSPLSAFLSLPLLSSSPPCLPLSPSCVGCVPAVHTIVG